MPKLTSTNIRVGPGAYSVLKWLSVKSGVSIGTVANLTIVLAMLATFKEQSPVPEDINQMMLADLTSGIGDVLKKLGPNLIRDKSLKGLYESLLRSDENE